MNKRPNLPPDAAELRRLAEERLKEQHPETGRGGPEADTQRLIHELRVHQIELEMQNEELQKARDEMEAGPEKYSDLYDFAPVGYLTLDPEGTILEANLTSASLLGIERSRLVQRRLGLYFSPATLPAFSDLLTRVFASRVKEFCEVTLLKDGKPPVEVRIGAVVAASGRECRVVLEDITERKRAEERLHQTNTELANRSGELAARNNELTRFNTAVVGRELRMIELKKEVNELCRQAGQPPRYRVDFDTKA
jgi:PAS domain S-box-containing protein